MDKNRTGNKGCGVLLYFVPVAEGVAYGLFQKLPFLDFALFMAWLLVLGGIILVYWLARGRWQKGGWALLLCAGVCTPLAMLCADFENLPLFLIGAVFASALSGVENGLALASYLGAVAVLCGTKGYLFAAMVLCFAYCILAQWLHGWKNIFCAIVTGEAATVIMIALITRFGTKPLEGMNLLVPIGFCAILLILAAMFSFTAKTIERKRSNSR